MCWIVSSLSEALKNLIPHSSSSHQSPIAHVLEVKLHEPLPPKLEFCLTWSCASLVHAVVMEEEFERSKEREVVPVCEEHWLHKTRLSQSPQQQSLHTQDKAATELTTAEPAHTRTAVLCETIFNLKFNFSNSYGTIQIFLFLLASILVISFFWGICLFHAS